MKRIMSFVSALFLLSMWGYCELVTLDSTSDVGDASRRVKTFVDFEETEAPELDLMPLYICWNKIDGLDGDDIAYDEEVTFEINDSDFKNWKQWASFDGSNDANTLKGWIDDGYSFDIPTSLPFSAADRPASLINTEYKPGTKATGIDHMQKRIDDGKADILVAVISENMDEVYGHQPNRKVTVCHFAKFKLTETKKLGSNKWIKAKYQGLATLPEFQDTKKVMPKASIETKPE